MTRGAEKWLPGEIGAVRESREGAEGNVFGATLYLGHKGQLVSCRFVQRPSSGLCPCAGATCEGWQLSEKH